MAYVIVGSSPANKVRRPFAERRVPLIAHLHPSRYTHVVLCPCIGGICNGPRPSMMQSIMRRTISFNFLCVNPAYARGENKVHVASRSVVDHMVTYLVRSLLPRRTASRSSPPLRLFIMPLFFFYHPSGWKAHLAMTTVQKNGRPNVHGAANSLNAIKIGR